MDRDNLETREVLLRRGLEVLTEQSFSATGLDYILKEVGIPKGSFYRKRSTNHTYHQMRLPFILAFPVSSSTAATPHSRPPTAQVAT
ncbi:hypothetical protein WX98_06050, partial [Pseudomonas syringae pv. persicae]